MEEKFTTRRHRDEEPIMLPERRGASKLPLAVAGIMTAVAVVFGVLYFAKPTSQDAVKNAKPSDNEAQTATPAEQTLQDNGGSISSKALQLAVDYDKGLNTSDEYIYGGTISNNMLGSAEIKTDGTVSLSITSDTAMQYYPDVYVDGYAANIDLSFSKKVASVTVGGAGQGVGSETFFFLMEDGTVEYMPAHEAILNDDYRSHGALKGVSDVVQIVMAHVHYHNYVGGHATTIAITSDGSFYDLFETAELKIH